MKKQKPKYKKEGNLIKPEKFKQSVSKSDLIVGLSCLLERALLMFNMAHENIEVCKGYSKAHAVGEAEALGNIIEAIEDEIRKAT